MKLQFDDDGDSWALLGVVTVIVVGAIILAWLS